MFSKNIGFSHCGPGGRQKFFETPEEEDVVGFAEAGVAEKLGDQTRPPHR